MPEDTARGAESAQASLEKPLDNTLGGAVSEEEEEEVFDSATVRPKFIPRGYENLDKHIFKNIFYSTSSGDSFRSPAAHAVRQPSLHAGAKGKSVQDIHDISRARGQYKHSTAPMYQRTMCSYTQEFVPRPLDGAQINKECYDLFKEKCESASTGAAGAQAQFRSETTTGDSFPEYDKDSCVKAIPPNFKPKQQKHVNSENKLLVTQSFSHKEYPCPSVEHTKNARPEAFKPKYKMHKSVGSLSSARSSYNRDYHPSKYDRVWPVKYRGMSEEPAAASGYTGKFRLDPKADPKLDPSTFHIGDVTEYGPC